MLLFHVLLRAVIQVSISTLEIGRFKKATTISNVKMPKIIFLLKVDLPYGIILSSVFIFLLITPRAQAACEPEAVHISWLSLGLP